MSLIPEQLTALNTAYRLAKQEANEDCAALTNHKEWEQKSEQDKRAEPPENRAQRKGNIDALRGYKSAFMLKRTLEYHVKRMEEAACVAKSKRDVFESQYNAKVKQEKRNAAFVAATPAPRPAAPRPAAPHPVATRPAAPRPAAPRPAATRPAAPVAVTPVAATPKEICKCVADIVKANIMAAMMRPILARRL